MKTLTVPLRIVASLLMVGMLSGMTVGAAIPTLTGEPVFYSVGQKTVVAWQTGIEVDVMGFHVYRQIVGGGLERLNAAMLPGYMAEGAWGNYCYTVTGSGAGYVLGLATVTGEERRIPCRQADAVPEWAVFPPEATAFQRVKAPVVVPVAAEPVRKARVSGTPAGAARLKITVTGEGVHRLEAATIAGGMGMTTNEVAERIATRQFRLSTGGVRVAWLSGGDAILFYNPAFRSRFATNTVFWLERGRGLVIPSLTGDIPTETASEALTFPCTQRFESNRIGAVYAFNNSEADFWMWETFSSGEKKTNFTFQLEGMAMPAASAEVVMALAGASYVSHQAGVTVNDIPMGEARWSGREQATLAFRLPGELISNAVNRITLSNGTANSSMYLLDYFDVTYQRLCRASGDLLIFRDISHPLLTVRGFSNAAVRLVDVTDYRMIREVQSVRVSEEADGFALSFYPASPTASYMVFSPAAVNNVVMVEGVADSSLRSNTNTADYLVITSAAMTNALQPLVNLRTARGFQCRVIEMREIADEFNAGVSAPEAIRAFLAHAWRYWKTRPRMVLLGGKGSYDYRNNSGNAVNVVPAALVPTSTYLFSSDNSLADVVGEDGVPEMAIGRLSAATAAQMTAMVSKIVDYEADAGGDWTRRVILTADDPDDGGDFPVSSEIAAALLPIDLIPRRIYLTQYSVSTARSLLFAAINEQAVLWEYHGHGGVNVMDGNWVHNNDMPLLTNGCRGPVLLGMTCFIGRYEVPGFISLAENLLLRAQGGAIAVWAPTGLSYNYLDEIVNSEFLRARYAGGERLLGEAVRHALGASAQSWVSRDILQIFTLHGDPGLRMK